MTQRSAALATTPDATKPLNLAADSRLSARFEAQAARTPDAIAIGDGVTTLSYRELNTRANQLARLLQTRGVRHGDLVAIAIPRSAPTILCMLAILKAGAAYLPLDPSHPCERLRGMIVDANARVVLTRGPAGAQGEPLMAGDRCIDIAALALELEEHGAGDLHEPGEPDDLAYIMYTSGSTGQPKGVLITHRAICNLVTCTPALAVQVGDVVAQLSNIAFDGATYEIWGALLNGARLEIIAREIMLSAVDLSRCLRDRHISVAFLTSALLAHVSREAPAAFATLRCLIAGGEVVDPAAVRAIFANGPPQRLLNGYGPSETTTFATTFEITAAPPGPIPIGRPIGNVQAYILDDDARAVPLGACGQLHIGGLGLARGYLNDPELTARKFIQYPVPADPFARVYATGDLARYLPDGNIEFLGRRDRQVKIRGFRIELDEIEISFKALPDVRAAVVMLREDEPGEKRLVAFVVDDATAKRSTAQWRALLARRLPDHMLPEAVVTVAALPLNANGKLDTQALTNALAQDRARPADSASGPRSPTEATVARIIADILGVARAGLHENFFALGGHSLLATRAIARLSDEFNIDLSLREFFAAPTIAELTERIAGAPCSPTRPARTLTGEVPRRNEQRGLRVPLSPGEQRLWLLAQIEPETSTYNVPYAFGLRGRLDRGALERALSTIVGRHDVLRAVVAAGDAETAYVVAEPFALELPVVLVPVESTLADVLARESSRPFDLSAQIPIRVLLVRRDADDYVLLVTFHHIATDGWSMGIFKRELGALYDAYRASGTSPLPELASTYAEFARLGTDERESVAHAGGLRYWQAQLADTPAPLDLAPRRDQRAGAAPGGALRSLRLGNDAVEGLRTFCRAQSTTLFATLFAAFGVLLHRWTGRRDFVIGTAFANRTRPEFDELIGFFVNTLPLRVKFAGDPPFAQWLAAVHRLTADAFEHQAVPFAAIVEATHPTRVSTRTPLLDVMFVLDTPFDSSLTLAGLQVTPIEVGRTTAKFDLTLEVTPIAGDLRIAFEYRTELFDAPTIDALLAAFATLLAAIVRDPRVPIGSLLVALPAAPRHHRQPEPDDTVIDGPAAPQDLRPDPVDTSKGEAQAALRALWETLLGVRPIGVNDNFFELGGHSLLAIRLLAQIERSFRVRLSPALLFERPTIEHLARAMCAAAAVRDRETAMVFNPHGSAPPLFFLHGSINGGGFYCRTLADRLGSNRPLYAIDPHRFAAASRPSTIEAMAAENVALVRRIAPHGPYLLGGYCTGGLIAFEMARRLRADGELVSNVILLDVPPAPARMRHIAQWIQGAGAALHIDAHLSLRLIGALARLPHRAARLAANPAKIRFVMRGLTKRLSGMRGATYDGDDSASSDTLLDPWFRVTEAYVPRRYDGALTVCLTEAPGSSAAFGRGWPAISPHVELRVLTGSHLTCITDFIGDTARVLGDVLA